MGRKKIRIQPIADERSRHATFAKRKNGLVKKAMELSLLCGCDIALVIYNSQGKLIQYSSGDIFEVLNRFVDERAAELYTNDSYPQFLNKDEREKVQKEKEERYDDSDGEPERVVVTNRGGTASATKIKKEVHGNSPERSHGHHNSKSKFDHQDSRNFKEQFTEQLHAKKKQRLAIDLPPEYDNSHPPVQVVNTAVVTTTTIIATSSNMHNNNNNNHNIHDNSHHNNNSNINSNNNNNNNNSSSASSTQSSSNSHDVPREHHPGNILISSGMNSTGSVPPALSPSQFSTGYPPLLSGNSVKMEGLQYDMFGPLSAEGIRGTAVTLSPAFHSPNCNWPSPLETDDPLT